MILNDRQARLLKALSDNNTSHAIHITYGNPVEATWHDERMGNVPVSNLYAQLMEAGLVTKPRGGFGCYAALTAKGRKAVASL